MPSYALSAAAVAALEEIWTWSVEQWGEDQADRYIDLLTRGLEKLAAEQVLADKPAQRILPKAPEGLFYHHIEEHYFFFDRPEPSHIRIYYVLHPRQQQELQRLLTARELETNFDQSEQPDSGED